jgi:hypothetical protein
MFMRNLVNILVYTIPLITSIPPNCANNRDFDNLLDNPTVLTFSSEGTCGLERAHDAEYLLVSTSGPEILHLVPSLIMNPGSSIILMWDSNPYRSQFVLRSCLFSQSK